MNIFTRYMGKKFFKPFFFGLGIFALLIFLGDLFDRMNYLVKSKASLGLILQYLWLEVPYWGIRIIPMATLLATLVSISGFIQSGEWIAVQSCGFETKTFWKPVLWCSLVVTLFSFIAQETVLPFCFKRAGQLWREKIHPEWEWDKYYDIVLLGKSDQFLQAHLFLPKSGLMERPILERVGPRGLERQIDARSALWDETRGRWIFHKGVERQFGKAGVREKSFASLESDLDTPPRSLVPRNRNPDEMSLRELLRHMKTSSPLGAPPREFMIAAHAKVAYPFTNLVICALGIPVALRLRAAAKVLSFISALVLSFLYLWCMEMSKTLGAGGHLHPLIAAWSANIIFGALAALLIRRYDVH